ncbi:MAG TPA: FecR domain-containing protein [Rhodanobacter sp.]|nr:FecR domain-containing protein [Rhodanobacter sp.]
MKTMDSDTVRELTLAEAAAWLTRLQDPERTPSTEAAFKAWLGASPMHARAFGRVNDVWELIPGAAAGFEEGASPRHRGHARRSSGQGARRSSRARPRRLLWLAASACALALLAVPVVMQVIRPVVDTYQTAVGAQRTVVLPDNTRITLNTDTRIAVTYDKHRRHVQLERGEALFQVTHDSDHPFTVTAGNATIDDIGTTFDVHRGPSDVAVALVEGELSVSASSTPEGTPGAPVALAPGQRLTVGADGAQVLDRPDMDEMLAWQQGRVYFDNDTLVDAVAELNRYGNPRLRLAGGDLADLRVSGVFSVHDQAQFAAAAAALHHLQISREGGEIVLKR